MQKARIVKYSSREELENARAFGAAKSTYTEILYTYETDQGFKYDQQSKNY